MPRVGILFLVLVVLMGACADDEPTGGERAPSPAEERGRERGSPTPGAASATDDAEAAEEDGQAAASGSEPSVPAPGAYVYELSTRSSEDTFTHDVRVQATDAGHRVTVESSSSRSATTARTVHRWGSGGILLEERTVTFSPELAFPCRIDARVELLRFPVRPTEYPVQDWENESCSGSVETTVEGLDEGDAAGRSWTAWRITRHVDMTTRSADGEQTFRVTYDETSWWSPELGMEIVRDRRSRGRIDGQQTEDRVVPVLREYPGAP